MLNAIDLVIILASMLFVISVGVFAGRKRADTAHGYFLGGNRMPWWLIGTAFVATGISSEQMIGTVGAAYQHGMGIANWEWFGLPCYAIVLTLFIPIYLKNKVTTVPGFLADRFGPACGTIYSCMLLAFYVCIYTVTVLYAGVWRSPKWHSPRLPPIGRSTRPFKGSSLRGEWSLPTRLPPIALST